MDVYRLEDTIWLMQSDNYQERFKAELYQTAIRMGKLYQVITHYDDGSLDFKPKTPLFILQKQWEAMNEYLELLKTRAEIEGIDLTWQG